MKIIVIWLTVLDVSSGKNIKLLVHQVKPGQQLTISAAEYLSRSEKVVYGKSDLDSHADTTVTGSNQSISISI